MENKEFVFTKEMAEDSRETAILQSALFSLIYYEDHEEIFMINDELIKLAEYGKGMTMLEDYSMLTPAQQKIFEKAIEKYKSIKQKI